MDSQNINEFMMINNQIVIEWTKTDVTMFWLLCLAILTTKELENKIISWLRNNTDLFWLDVLGSLALGLIT